MKKFHWFILILLFSLFNNEIKAQVNIRDSLALVDLYNNTGGSNWTHSNHWLRGPVSTWYGITIKNMNVVAIDLFQNNLNGVLPLSFGNLKKLVTLELGWNHLHGQIPATIGNLTNLFAAGLDVNEFDDTIPASIGNCTTLANLDLSENHIKGNIPASFGNCINLLELNLSKNQISGEIPESIGRSTHLYTLRLNNNKLTGNIPDSIGYYPYLYDLDLSFNQLTGSIPSSIGNLINLTDLVLINNRLSGPIPASLGNLTKVVNVTLYGNLLSGPIPSSLGNLVNANSIELNHNKLTGSIPASLAKLDNLYELNLGDNELTGSIPAAFADTNKHTNLSVSYNHLSQVGNIDFPDFYNPKFYTGLDHNWFTFDGLEFVAVHLPLVQYSPQSNIHIHQHSNYLSVYAGGTLTNNTYQWSKDGVVVKKVKGDSTFRATVNGNYSVKVANSIATKLTLYSDTIYYASSNSSSDIVTSASNSENFAIYPNPAKTITTVSFNAIGNCTLKLSNIAGNILQEKTINASGKSTVNLNLSKYPGGVYFVSLINEGKPAQTLQLNKE
jgi:Leucine-rich repeat (LRR) protein